MEAPGWRVFGTRQEIAFAKDGSGRNRRGGMRWWESGGRPCFPWREAALEKRAVALRHLVEPLSAFRPFPRFAPFPVPPLSPFRPFPHDRSLVRGDVADWPFSPFPPPHPPPLPLPARSPHPFPPPFRSPLISLRFPPTPRVHPSSRAPTSLPRFPSPPPDPLLSPPTPPPQHTVWLTSHPLPTPCLPSSLTRSSSLPLSTLRSPRSPRPPLVFPLTHPSFLPTIHPYYLPVPLALPSSFYSLTPHFSPPIHPYYLPSLPPTPSRSICHSPSAHPSSPPTYLRLPPLISLLFSNLSLLTPHTPLNPLPT
ncbi:unnamed protein product [Closterium sp. Naga37s-1]|nr:unnamed protein product [Closterium sp. Naga37s-1]